MSLIPLLDKASSRFRLKHEQPNFKGPQIWLDHLRPQSDLPDLLVCLVGKETVGETAQVRVRD